MLDPGVDAVAVGLGAREELRRDLRDHLVDLGVGVVVAAGDQVVVEVGRAEDLGETAAGRAAEELELEETVLSDRVADTPPGVGVAVGGDGRHAVGVARDRDAGTRRFGRPRLVEQLRLVIEVAVELDLVGQVRRAGPVRDAGDRHVAALPRREHVLGLQHRGARGRGEDRKQGRRE